MAKEEIGIVVYKKGPYMVAPQRTKETIVSFGKVVYEVTTLKGPTDGGPEAIAVCWDKAQAKRIAFALAEPLLEDLLEVARQIVLADQQHEGDIPDDIIAGAKDAIEQAGG